MKRIWLFVFSSTLLLLQGVFAVAEEAKRSASPVEVQNPVVEGRRVALVIGNARYDPPLKNPLNDAADMARLLGLLGFAVIPGENLTREEMSDRLQDFARQSASAEVALFYYAGHGFQYEGRSYLLPVDARITDEYSVRHQAISAEDVFQDMVGSGRTSIALLDACRDNAISRRFRSTRSTSVSRGLALPRFENGGLLVGYATAAGEVAEDGDGRNSPFTQALLARLGEEGVEIEETLKRVRIDVIRATKNRQVPWTSTGLTAYLKLVPAKSKPLSQPLDEQLWNTLKESGDVEGLRYFIRQFPTSVYAPSAFDRLRALSGKQDLKIEELDIMRATIKGPGQAAADGSEQMKSAIELRRKLFYDRLPLTE